MSKIKLSISKILFGILVFGVITNLLIFFDVKFFHLRAIFSFIFLIMIPGILILLILKIRKISFWEYAVYIVGLSTAFVIFLGLVINWININPNFNKWSTDSASKDESSCSIEELELPTPVHNIRIGANNVLYGYYEDEIVKSEDNGITWDTIYRFDVGEGNRRVWVDSRGTIFAGRDETGKLYMSKGGDNNWTTSLNFSCQNKPLESGQSEGYGTLWNMDEDSLGNLYVGEYGGEMNATCAYIYKSLDGGLSWDISYDSEAYGWSGRHIHVLKVDPKNNYIYATQGDGYERARLIRSTDYGKTWNTIQRNTPYDQNYNQDAQYTSIIFYPNYRILGTDTKSPNKIIKTENDLFFSPVSNSGNEIKEFAWTSSKNFDGIAFIGTVSEGAGNHVGLFRSGDGGITWSSVKDAGETKSTFQGIDNISNFNSDGYAYYHDNNNNKTYKFKDVCIGAIKEKSFFIRTTEPLSFYRVLVVFDIFFLILTFLSFKLNKNTKFNFRIGGAGFLNGAFFVSALFLPVLSIMGAVVLNNGGPNVLTMIMLGGIAIYVFLVVLLRKNLSKNIYPFSVLMISVALLMMGWLRSQFVSGADINLEYHIFQLIKTHNFWNPSLFSSAYTACLSITILPTILSSFLNINDQYIFKFIIPLMFSITPVCVYLFLRRYTLDVYAFVAAFFFMTQATFMSWWWIPVRQEVAFIFFALSLLIMFNKNISFIRKKIILLIFLFSMVVSHYSTTYVTIILLTLTYLLWLIFRITKRAKFVSRVYEKLNFKNRLELRDEYSYVNGIVLIIFIAFSVIWYYQITKTSDNIIGFVDKTNQNIGKIFSDETRAEGTSFGSQWNILYKQKNKSSSLHDYIAKATSKYKSLSYMKIYSQDKFNKYEINVFPVSQLPMKLGTNVTATVYIFGGFVQKIIKLFIILYIFYLIFFRFKINDIDREYIIMAVVSIFMMVAIMALPFASIDYDLMRQYQQLLAILSLPAVLGGVMMFKFINKENVKELTLSVVFLFYFLFISGFIPQIVGGAYPLLQLNNSGGSFDELYIHDTEIKSSRWLFDNRVNDEMIYVDARAFYKLWFSNYVSMSKIIKDVFPSTIDRDAYVYSSYTNTLRGVSFISINGNLINYNFPTEFLNQNKDLIYNNGESKIFK